MNDLTIKEVSLFLLLSEKEILKKIREGDLPHHCIQEKIYFNKQQIIEWALLNNRPVNLAGHQHFAEFQVQSILPLIQEDSFYYHVIMDETNYISTMVHQARFSNPVDRDVVVQLLQYRESLMSTAIGNGIALPHPRIPLMLGQEKPMLLFFFPEKPLSLNAIDGLPVHTLILLIAQTVRQHLSILAHISYLLSKPEFRESLKQRQSPQEIMNWIHQLETLRQ